MSKMDDFDELQDFAADFAATSGAKPRINRKRLEQRYAKLLEQYADAERQLARAARRWDKLRVLRNRAERQLDLLQKAAEEAGT